MATQFLSFCRIMLFSFQGASGRPTRFKNGPPVSTKCPCERPYRIRPVSLEKHSSDALPLRMYASGVSMTLGTPDSVGRFVRDGTSSNCSSSTCQPKESVKVNDSNPLASSGRGRISVPSVRGGTYPNTAVPLWSSSVQWTEISFRFVWLKRL